MAYLKRLVAQVCRNAILMTWKLFAVAFLDGSHQLTVLGSFAGITAAIRISTNALRALERSMVAGLGRIKLYFALINSWHMNRSLQHIEHIYRVNI